MHDKLILPGATIGVFGSGQLGRMLALAARPMGYQVATYSTAPNSPAGQVADLEIVGNYDDLERVTEFVQQVDVVTFEFENVPSQIAEVAQAAGIPVRPSGRVLHIAQNRLREKICLVDAGFPVTPFVAVKNHEDLSDAVQQLGLPFILKTAAFGYDGKGQVRVNHLNEVDDAWLAMKGAEAVAEAFIDYEREVSVVAARGIDGGFAHYGVIENLHRNHILDVSIAPARVDDRCAKEAVDFAQQVLVYLNVVGVLCIEFFVQRDGALLINEIAPRPHNSGHLTIESTSCSQFEQQLRAVCGLVLGSTDLLRPAVMINLLGDLWGNGEPDWSHLLTQPDCHLHLYGKAEARPGRKMGHFTVLGENRGEILRIGERLQGGLLEYSS